MKLTIMAALLAALPAFAAPVLAQAPAAPAPSGTAAVPLPESQLKLSRDLIEATGIARTFDAALPDMALRIRQSFAAQRPELMKDMDDTLVALLPEVRTRRGEMIERSARAMGVLFTEAELKELTTFFASASGRKYVALQPQLLNEVFTAMEPWMQQTSEFFINRFREEMRKKGHTI